MNNIIEIKDLKKHFKEVKAVDGISFLFSFCVLIIIYIMKYNSKEAKRGSTK